MYGKKMKKKKHAVSQNSQLDVSSTQVEWKGHEFAFKM